MKEWIEQDADQSSVDILLGGLGVSKIVAELMAKRGFHDPVIADQFLVPKLKHLQDPFLIQNMEAAVNRIFVAREKNKGFNCGRITMWMEFLHGYDKAGP